MQNMKKNEKKRIKVTFISVVIFIFLFLSLFLTPAFASQVDQTNIENITEQLTQYRRMVGIEDDKAAAYIKEKMEEYGLDAHLEAFSGWNCI